MRNRDKILGLVITLILIYAIANIGAINSFFTFSTDKTIDEGHSQITVPEAWNTTYELNMTDVKTNCSITNQYVVWEVWEDWPESQITDVSEQRFRAMEHGGYEVLNRSNETFSGMNMSKEYFYNPSRDSQTQWDCIGVSYVFEHEDTNYAVQVHYFTKIDYANQSYIREVDDRMEDFKENIHNKNYNGFFSGINKIIQYFNQLIKQDRK